MSNGLSLLPLHCILEIVVLSLIQKYFFFITWLEIFDSAVFAFLLVCLFEVALILHPFYLNLSHQNTSTSFKLLKCIQCYNTFT